MEVGFAGTPLARSAVRLPFDRVVFADEEEDMMRKPFPIAHLVVALALGKGFLIDRKSTRLNSSHLGISYAVFCLKKKKKHHKEFSDRNNTRHNYHHTNTSYASFRSKKQPTCL